MNETNGTSNPAGTPTFIERQTAPQPPSPAIAGKRVARYTEADFAVDLGKATQRRSPKTAS